MRARTMVTAILACALLASLARDAAPPANFVRGVSYTDDYVVKGNVWTGVTGGGTAIFAGFWDARRSGKSLWKADGTNLSIAATARMDNNFAGGATPVLFAANFQIEGSALNTGVNNEVFEFDPEFSADRGTGTIGRTSGNPIVGGLTSMRVHNARLVTHHSRNLPTAWKNSRDGSLLFPAGSVHDSHHGLLVFADVVDHDGTAADTPATSSEWAVRTHDQTYDGGLYWHNDWTLDVAPGVTLTSNTHWEHAAIGPHVGIGSRADGTTMVMTGGGSLVVARGGVQGYRPGSVIDVRHGRVEFNSNEAQTDPNRYLRGAAGASLQLLVSATSEVDFNAYTYPYPDNHSNGSTYGVDSLHQVQSIDARGKIRLGGLWSPSADQLDIDYHDLLEAVKPETADARDARLEVMGDLVLHPTSTLEIVLGGENRADAWRVDVAGAFAQCGVLSIIDDGTLAHGTYRLFDDDVAFSGGFTLELPPGFTGSYDNSTGALTITTVPESVSRTTVFASGGTGARAR